MDDTPTSCHLYKNKAVSILFCGRLCGIEVPPISDLDLSWVSLSCQSCLYHQITDSNQTDQKHLNKHQWEKNELKRQKHLWHLCLLWLLFCLGHVPSVNMEEAGFMTYNAASHQGAIETLWLQLYETSSVSTVFLRRADSRLRKSQSQNPNCPLIKPLVQNLTDIWSSNKQTIQPWNNHFNMLNILQDHMTLVMVTDTFI